MRILAFDHFFWQDLDELSRHVEPEHQVIRISYRRWHEVAKRYFPASAFDGISNAFRPEMSDCWKKYETWVAREIAWVLNAYEPNLFVTPSDTFFYLRPFIEKFREQGLKTFVMQKETTISPMVMRVHSQEIARYVPFIGDFMTVSSDRHKQFWLNALTNPELVVVTGQPRFDKYKRVNNPEKILSRRKNILYLSYDDIAYLPSDLGSEFEGSWRDQRLATEVVLAEISQFHNVVVKKHPQQSASEEMLGPLVVLADRFADTRELIMSADIVVGFQTTALFEAAVAGKPVVYAAWGDVFKENKDALIRFDLAKDLVVHAQSPEDLKILLTNEIDELKIATENSLAIVFEELGPIDGCATERTWNWMKKFNCDVHVAPVTKQEKFRALTQILWSSFYFLLFMTSKIVAPSKSVGIRARMLISTQILSELRRIFRYSRKVSSHE